MRLLLWWRHDLLQLRLDVVYLDIYLFCIYGGWLGSRLVSVLDSGVEGPGSNRSRDAVG